MVEESDVVGFLKDHDGQASLDEISEGLGVPNARAHNRASWRWQVDFG